MVHKLRYILCPCWHGIGLVNTSCNRFCVLAGMGEVLSTRVEMNFLCSPAKDVFGQH